MEPQQIFYTLSISFIFTILIIYKLISNARRKPLLKSPPTPSGSLPMVGHLHLLTNLLHRSLHQFSQKLGPIFMLHFGPKQVIIISSSTLAHECLGRNDIIFANRPAPAVDRRSLGFSNTSVIGAPYGHLWRNLRKLCDMEVFAPTRLASFLSIRRDERDRMIAGLYKISTAGWTRVNVESKIVEMIFNNIMRMIAGKRYYGVEAENDEEAKRFRELTKEALELTSASNLGEIFPVLRWIGCNGLEKKLAVHTRKTDEFMEELLEGCRRGKHSNTMVDHLLNLQKSEPEYYTDKVITELIVALIIAGIDASVVTTEWVMTLLLNHPKVMEKAKQELDNVVGHNRMVEEYDLPNLHYLHCIILETLRLYPSVPLLVPHMPSQDCTIGGYNIPEGTMVLINAWSIHRDSNVWDSPTSFMPERFEGSRQDKLKTNVPEKTEVAETQKLFPFGMGRRACPGSGLAQKYVGLGVASLVHCFDWKRIGGEEIDVSEGSGTTLVKVKTLEATCKPRNVMEKVLAQILN